MVCYLRIERYFISIYFFGLGEKLKMVNVLKYCYLEILGEKYIRIFQVFYDQYCYKVKEGKVNI